MASPRLPSASAHLPFFLAGPTAVGKSGIALALAEQIGGEIISVDSMQVYRGLDIGTAKPTVAESKKISHHLIDVCNLSEAFDAAQFIRLAQKAVEEIQLRRHTPIFCGGTGLYIKAFLDGLGEAPPADETIRAELEAAPFEALLAELRARDPAAYEKIDKKNPRRVIRAVEVIRLTGKKFSDQRAEWKTQNPKIFLLHALGRRSAPAHQRPCGRDVCARTRRRDARLAPRRVGGEQVCVAGYRLSPGGRTSARRARFSCDD